MNEFGLEKDCLTFIKKKQELKYDVERAEPGFVGLIDEGHLVLGEVWIDGGDKEASFYRIPAVNLSGSCETYSPEYILLWLPNEKVYGTWDCDHWKLIIFKNAKWQDIVLNPLKYINCQWDLDQNVGIIYNPENKYEKIKGMPF